MTTHKDELISALMDGASRRFETHRAIDLLLSDSHLRQRWDRYHLIGDVLRRDVKHVVPADFCAGVMDHLEKAQPRKNPAPYWVQQRWLKPLLGLAMAASVAGVMVLGLQSLWQPEQTGANLLQQGLPAAGQRRLAEIEPPHDTGHHVPTQLESYMRMNSYLLSHAEQTSGQGFMPYVRMVSYTSGQ